MTCIVGLVDNGKVYIGGDSAGVVVSRLDIISRKDKKVFRVNDVIMGFTTSFRMGQLLQYNFRPPKRHPDDDLMKYMVVEFINEIRRIFKDGGFATKDQEAEIGGNFLVGIEGRLFEIGGDYQVGESNDKIAACGCGYAYALGSLYSTTNSPPHERIIEALSAATKFSAGVQDPFNVEVL